MKYSLVEGEPILEVLQYQVNSWRNWSKPQNSAGCQKSV